MRVSVVIPCYNSLEFLPQTLESVFNQDLEKSVITDFEVVLVDDGGSDNLSDWLAGQTYPSDGPKRVRVIRQDNAGVSAARNFGVANSAGDVVAFCDSDDLWTPTTAAQLAKCFTDESGIGLVYGFYEVVEADGKSTGRVITSDASGDVWEDFVLDNPVSASGVMVSRDAFEESGGFSQNRDKFPIDVEDWELWIRIASKWRVGRVANVIALHRRHDSNSSTDIESLQLAYENLMEVVFGDAPAARQALRPRAEARYKMILAWQSLNDRRDANAARRYLAEAVGGLGSLRRTPEYWRLRASVALLRIMGEKGYSSVRNANKIFRRARRSQSADPDTQ